MEGADEFSRAASGSKTMLIKSCDGFSGNSTKGHLRNPIRVPSPTSWISGSQNTPPGK